MSKTCTIGFDPGESNLGIGIYYSEQGWGRFRIVDLTTWGDKKHKLKEEDLGPIIFDLVRGMHKDLERCTAVGIEKQPNIGSRNILIIQVCLEQAIRGFYNAMPIHLTIPHEVRVFWDTKGGRNYDERKARSRDSDMLTEAGLKRAKLTFTKKTAFKIDAIEAMQVATYVAETKLRRPLIHPSQPRVYSTRECKLNVVVRDSQ